MGGARAGRASGAQLVYTTLRERIMRHDLSPGHRLAETELAASLSVSRTPLREALRMLQSEGLVHQLPTGGMVVAPLDAADLDDLYVVRAAVEAAVAGQACSRLTDGDLAEMDRLVDQMDLLIEYPAEMQRLGGLFHGLLLRASGNARAEEVLEQMRGHLARYQVVTNADDERRRQAAAEHRSILAALKDRDVEAAEQRMRAHIMAAAKEGLTHWGEG